MKRTRRICALGMAGIMAFSMAACGSKDGGNGGNGDGSPKGGDGGGGICIGRSSCYRYD